MKLNLDKYFIDEPIKVGDLISYVPDTNKVTRTVVDDWKDIEQTKVIGICISNINNSTITITDTGIVDVHVAGIVCIGDRLCASDKVGIAKAIRYNQDETKFRYRHIGKVIGLYNDYNTAKVLLDIE